MLKRRQTGRRSEHKENEKEGTRRKREWKDRNKEEGEEH